MEAINKAISSQEIKAVENALNQYNLEKMDVLDQIDSLKNILNYAMSINAKGKMLEVILNRWCKPFEASSPLVVIGQIAGTFHIPVSILEYIMKRISGSSAYLVMKETIKDPSCPIFGMMADRLLKAKPDDILPSNWTLLLRIAEENNRTEACRYIEDKIRETSEPATKHQDIKFTEADAKLDPKMLNISEWKDYKPKIHTDKNVNELVEHIQEHMKLETEDGSDIDTKILADVARIALSTTQKVSTEIDPDRIFGPVNAIMKRECPTGIAGGCRMLTCRCRDFDQADDSTPIDPDTGEEWFEGNCDCCGGEILDISHAVRQPVPNGGWCGTYCCIEHIAIRPVRSLGSDEQKKAVNAEDEEEIDHDEEKDDDTVTDQVNAALLLSRLRGTLEEKGIIDRVRWLNKTVKSKSQKRAEKAKAEEEARKASKANRKASKKAETALSVALPKVSKAPSAPSFPSRITVNGKK